MKTKKCDKVIKFCINFGFVLKLYVFFRLPRNFQKPDAESLRSSSTESILRNPVFVCLCVCLVSVCRLFVHFARLCNEFYTTLKS